MCTGYLLENVDWILGHYEGVISIADDIIIYGKDEEHDRRLHKFMKVARE